jgi:hypothetical protein
VKQELDREGKDMHLDTRTIISRSVIISHVREILTSLEVPDDAATAHRMVSDALTVGGWNVRNEVRVKMLGMRQGRIDLVARKDILGVPCEVAVEIDRCCPRMKSLLKLWTWQPISPLNGARVILTRKWTGHPIPDGIDALWDIGEKLTRKVTNDDDDDDNSGA